MWPSALAGRGQEVSRGGEFWRDIYSREKRSERETRYLMVTYIQRQMDPATSEAIKKKLMLERFQEEV